MTGMVGQLQMAGPAPVAFDGELADQGLEAVEGGDGDIPHRPAARHGEELGQRVLAPGVRHPAVAAARPPTDALPLDDQGLASPPGQLEPAASPV